MKMRIVSLVLALIMLIGCFSTANASAEESDNESVWNFDVVWASYGGVLTFTRADGKEMTFAVEYRTIDAFSDVKYFWLGYVPEGEEIEDASIFIQLLSDDHNLILSDDGKYILLISEEAAKKAYDFWMEVQETKK